MQQLLTDLAIHRLTALRLEGQRLTESQLNQYATYLGQYSRLQRQFASDRMACQRAAKGPQNP
ncbi:hypothetical protein [Spirosoma sp. KNUC1025]|uniref:hypothetical protein n=1 Tax=Spirosoma sp. KNUC1025 TaxID=2894082 RepID=UPI001E3D8B3A|nr:hypothetical protein [Spirosoma sp. KNUC1025]UFH57740.1 hypothetical protein LN737_32460 [Spirosoma sp. KNUC1025]